MLDALIKNTETIIDKIINILPKKILNEINFRPTDKKYDTIKDVFVLFEIFAKIYKYDEIVVLAREYKVSFIDELDKELYRLKNVFYNESKKYTEDIASYLKNSSQLSQDILILKYIPYDNKIIKEINDTHEYIILKKDINYDSILSIKTPVKVGIDEKLVKAFVSIQNPPPIKPFITTISTNQFINIPNTLLNEYFDTVELVSREVDDYIRLSDLEKPAIVETNQDIEIYLYNYNANLRENIQEKEVDISIWAFLKKY